MTELNRKAFLKTTSETADALYLGGYGVVYGGVDLEGDFFTKSTNFMDLPLGKDVNIDHKDPTVISKGTDIYVLDGITKAVGRIINVTPDDIGLYFDLMVEKSNEYWELVKMLVESGRLGLSTGSNPTARKTHDGNITVWPIDEISLTVYPAEPRTVVGFDTGGEKFTGGVKIDPMNLSKNTETESAEEPQEDETSEDQSADDSDISTDEPIQADEEESDNHEFEELDMSNQEEAQNPDVTQENLEVETPVSETAQSVDSAQLEMMETMTKSLLAMNAKIEQMEARVSNDLPAEGSAGQTFNKNINQINVKNIGDEAGILTDSVRALTSGRYKKVILSTDPKKVLAEGTDTTGGYIVPLQQSTDLIELLRANAVMRRIGSRVIPMTRDQMTIPKMTGSGTAYWTAENAALTASDQAFGQVTLTAKKLTALTKSSSELFEDSDPAIEPIIRNDLMRIIGLAEDVAFIRGDGAGASPTGLRNIAGVNVTSLGTNGAVITLDALKDMTYRLDANNAPMEGRAFIMNPRELNIIAKSVKNSEENNYAFSEPANYMDPATLWGYPVYTTTQIPINLTQGTATDASEIYFGAFSDALIGQRKTIELMASNVAGNAFENDQVFIRAIQRVDFQVRHAESFEVLTGAINA